MTYSCWLFYFVGQLTVGYDIKQMSSNWSKTLSISQWHAASPHSFQKQTFDLKFSRLLGMSCKWLHKIGFLLKFRKYFCSIEVDKYPHKNIYKILIYHRLMAEVNFIIYIINFQPFHFIFVELVPVQENCVMKMKWYVSLENM